MIDGLFFIKTVFFSAIAGAVIHALGTYLGVAEKLMTKLTIFAVILVVYASFAAHNFNRNKIVDQKLIVGISADFPPFTFLDKGTLAGFEIELVNELSRCLNRPVEFRNIPFGGLIPALQLNHLHVVAGGLTETPERAKHILFTKPYLKNNPLVIISSKKQPIHNLEELGSSTVVVNEGYTADLYLSEKPNLSILRLKTPAEAFLALRNGRAVAFVTAHDTLKPFFDTYGKLEFEAVEISGTNEATSLAITTHQPDLLNEIQICLDQLEKNGILAQLRTKWGLS